jgi:hypothetical protein
MRNLALFLIMLVVGGGDIGCDKVRGQHRSPEATDGGPSVPSNDAAVPAAFAVGPIASFIECLRDENGLPVRAIISQPATAAIETPPDGAVTRRLPFFAKFYVFSQKSAGHGTYYELGSTPKRSSVFGWVDGRSVTPWNNNIGYRTIIRSDGRALPVLVYDSRESLVSLITTGKPLQEPIARITPALDPSGRPKNPFPTLRTSQFTDAHGRVFEISQIAFLGAFRRGGEVGDDADRANEKAGMSEEGFAALQQDQQQIDLVICIDVTGSVNPYWEQMKQAVRELTTIIAKMPFKPLLRVRIIPFKDYDKASEFVVKRDLPLTSDLAKMVDSLDIKPGGGGDYPEAGLDALDEALRTNFSGKLSHRIVAYISDASWHEGPAEAAGNPHGFASEQIVQRARARGADVHISFLNVVNQSKEGRADEPRRLGQFRSIASQTGGAVANIDNLEAITNSIGELFSKQTAVVRTNDEVLKALHKQSGAPSTDIDPREVENVVEFLKGRGVDPSQIRPGEVGFATGWVAVEHPKTGDPVLSRHVFVTKDELRQISSTTVLLTNITDASLPGLVADGSLLSRTNPLFFDFLRRRPADPQHDLQLDTWLAARGLPLSKTSILRRTKAEIIGMSENERAALRAVIEGTTHPKIQNAITDSDLWRPRDDGVDVGWIDEAILP